MTISDCPVREQPQNNNSRWKSWSEQNGIKVADPSYSLLWLQAPLAWASFPTVYGSRTLLCPPLLPQAQKRRSAAFAVPTYGILFLPPCQLFLRNTKTVNRGWGNGALRFFFLGMRTKIGLRVFGPFPDAMSLSLPGTASVQSSWQ